MGGGRPAGTGQPGNNTMGVTGGRPRQVPVSVPGFVDLQQGGAQGGARQGGGFGGQLPDVTDAQCKAITAARTAKPAAAKKVDDLSAKMRDPNADRQTLMTDLRAAYTELGVDMQIVRACRARENNGGGAPPQAATSAGGRPKGAAAGRSAARVATRTGLVFVQKADSTWEPRVVRLGTADYDYTEVISGLEEGERVAMLSAAALQVQRQENNDRFKAMTGGGSPLGGAGAGAGGGRPPGR